jgi:carboxylesterase type B
LEKEAAPIPLARVTSFSRDGVRPYAPETGDGVDILARVVDDRVFRCGNLALARKARNAGARAYGFLFQQRPLYSLYGALPVCAAAARRVCHSFELPYVFGVIADDYKAATGKDLPRGANDGALARRMVAAWAGFAHAPDRPPAPWSLAGEDRLAVWGGGDDAQDQEPIAIDDFAQAANCDFWLGANP